MKKHLSAVGIFLLASCSTFLTGAKQQIVIRANIVGTKVYMGDDLKCTTPCTLSLEKQRTPYYFTLKAEGWKEVTVELHSAVNAMLTSNSSNLSVGSLTDLTTGAFWAYNQDTLYVVLSPIKGTPKAETKNALALEKYAFSNFSMIQSEALAGHAQGEYSSALSRKTGLPVKEIWQILQDKKTPADFAAEIAGRFHSR